MIFSQSVVYSPGSTSKPTYICLIEAAAKGDLSQLVGLLERNANVDSCDVTGRTALHLASSEGHMCIVDELVKRGACLNIQDHQGRQPLQEALVNGHKGVVNALVRGGVRPSDSCL
jgi:glutaminase